MIKLDDCNINLVTYLSFSDIDIATFFFLNNRKYLISKRK